MKERILIVDDEKNIVSSLEGILSDEGYQVSVAKDGLDALELVQNDPPDLLLLDIWLPGMDGIEVLKTVKAYHPEIEVLIMSGHGTIDTAVKATKLGAFDFIEKPFSIDQLTQSVGMILKQKKSPHSHRETDVTNSSRLPLCFESMVDVKKSIKTFARSNKPVLLIGESGTGKELIAQAIHRQSRKSDRPFVKLNCSVRRMQDIQSQLLIPAGKGGRHGKRSLRDRNRMEKVIFLSHVESLSKGLQDKLARALAPDSSRQKDTPEFLPARLYVSSTRDLHQLAEKGQFNPELLDCFKDTLLHVPPLRDYAGNIPILVKDYFEEQTQSTASVPPQIDQDTMNAMTSYHWPGNIRELRSVIDQFLVMSDTRSHITLQDLPLQIRASQVSFETQELEQFESLQEAELTWEREFLIHHLKKNGWDLEKTCQALKTDNDKLTEKLQRHEIRLPETLGLTDTTQRLQRTLKRSVVLCGSGLHSGIKTGLILQPLPPGSGIIFGDISSGQTIPARLEYIQSTDYSTCLKKGFASVGTIEHIMAVLHMYRISNLLIKIGDEAPVMDGSAKDFCDLIEDGEFEEQDELTEELVIDKEYRFGSKKNDQPHISIEPSENFVVSYHMEYPKPIGTQDYTFKFKGEKSFKQEIAPARTFGFLEDVAQLTKMGFASGGKLDNFILLGDSKVLNTELRYKDEFARHKILDILGDFYLLGRPIRGHIKAHMSGHTQNIGLLKMVQKSLQSQVAKTA